jgi:glycine/D-amino acid oxidase-like deaminating enzyme
MPERTGTVAVIGGGIAGLGLARELARNGFGVTLFEAGTFGGQGASALPAALLNPYRGRSARASPLDRHGLSAFWRLHDELAALGLPSGATRSGVLRIPSKARQARGWRTLAAADDDLAWLEPETVPPELHAPFGALHVLRGGWVQPAILLRSLATAAHDAGATLRESERVRALDPGSDGVRVTSGAGSEPFDLAVLCIGATPAPEGVALPPLERIEGDIVTLAGPARLPRPIAGAVYAVQRDATVLVGGNHRPAGHPDPEAPERLRRSLGWFAPPLADAPIVGVWRGVRARHEGNRPLLQRLGPRVWLYGALAGRGFLCGALLAQRLTATLRMGRA